MLRSKKNGSKKRNSTSINPYGGPSSTHERQSHRERGQGKMRQTGLDKQTRDQPEASHYHDREGTTHTDQREIRFHGGRLRELARALLERQIIYMTSQSREPRSRDHQAQPKCKQDGAKHRTKEQRRIQNPLRQEKTRGYTGKENFFFHPPTQTDQGKNKRLGLHREPRTVGVSPGAQRIPDPANPGAITQRPQNKTKHEQNHLHGGAMDLCK